MCRNRFLWLLAAIVFLLTSLLRLDWLLRRCMIQRDWRASSQSPLGIRRRYMTTYEFNSTTTSIPSTTQKTIPPPNGTIVFQELIAQISHSAFNNSFNYSVIYERLFDHVTPLVTSFRCLHSYHIIIFITSEITRKKQREWIRKTWGRDHISPQPRWKTFFVIGKVEDKKTTYNLVKEIYEFNDIILVDTQESFYNLVPKLQAEFEWSSKYCNYKYLLKGDDDIFVNIVQLFDFVNSRNIPKRSLYAGNIIPSARVKRNGQYGMSRKEYWKNWYPRYCSGGGFVLSSDVPPKFLKVLKGVKVIKIDDAYIGELALRAEVNVYDAIGFRFFEGSACTYVHWYIVHHPVKSWQCMQSLYNKCEPNLTQKLEDRVL